MQFLNIALVALASLSAVDACKCYAKTFHHQGNTYRNDITEKCCNSVRGKYEGDDCVAHSIEKWMSSFATCCRTSGNFISDCKGGMNCC